MKTLDTIIEARQMLERREHAAWAAKHSDAALTALREYEEQHKPYVPPPPPPGVDEQFAKVREKWPSAMIEAREFVNDTYRWTAHLVTIPDFPLPPGYDRPTCAVYFVVPSGYPYASPERFYTDRLRMENGCTPYMSRHLQVTPQMGGRPETMDWFPATEDTMLWFWRVNRWNPDRDTLRTYVSVIKARLDNVKAGERRWCDE